jgi:flagellar basal-body rod protein FlgG
MIRSLYTAASGMIGQQTNIDTISNNLSNVNTVGFKKNRVDFQDMYYQTLREPGTKNTINTTFPTPIEMGTGVRPASTQKIFVQGDMQVTENLFDIAIMGSGFFKIRMEDGTEAYTRSGKLTIDANGDLVTDNGNFFIDPPVTLPKDYYENSLSISTDGTVSVKIPGSEEPIVVGYLKLYNFINPSGLKAIGDNLLKETVASGPAYEGTPGTDGFGKLNQGFLEMSNVKIVDELVNMIVAQRAYEFNSKAIQTSDQMLATAVNLKR